nr:galactose mutarotase [Lachnospiraceae bacterium]
DDHLHGGRKGFNRYVWQCKESDDALVFSRISPDMEENYPGNLNVTVTYQLTKDNELIIDYKAISDKDTIVNLSNHSYFNLNGVSDLQDDLSVLNHKIKLYADRKLTMDNDKRPDGNIISCIGTPYDFSSFKTVGDGIAIMNNGYDDYYIANENHGSLKKLKVVAEAYSEKTRIKMTCQSEEPGFIFYTGNYLFKKSGKYNKEYNQYSGFCIETHGYIDSIHNKNFPSLILPKNQEYHTRTVYSFDIF